MTNKTTPDSFFCGKSSKHSLSQKNSRISMLSPMQLPSAFKLFSSDFLLYPWAHYFLFLIGVGESTEAEVVASETLLLIWEDTMSHTGTDFSSYSHVKLWKLVTIPTKAYTVNPSLCYPYFSKGCQKIRKHSLCFID